jgi:Flp pilus assembly protein TadD
MTGDSSIEEIFFEVNRNIQKKNYDLAISHLKKILEFDKSNLKAIFLLGTMLLQTKKFNDAKSFFLKAILISPKFSNAHNNLGIVHKELGQSKEAEKNFISAIKINPKSIEAYNNLGLLYKELDELEKSKKNFEIAIHINPNYVVAYSNLSTVYKKMEEFDKSERLLIKAIQLQPNFLDAHINLMEIYEKTNKDSKLNNAIISAENEFKNKPEVNFYKAKLLYKKEFFLKTIEILNSFKFNENISLEILRNSVLAKSYDKLNNIDKAFEFFQISNELTFKHKNTNINKDKYIALVNSRLSIIKTITDKEWPTTNLKNKMAEPVFMIGFPRSGTTLLDTILRSHPLVEVIEEKPILKTLIDSLEKLHSGSYQALKKINEYKIKKIRNNYYKELNFYIKERDPKKIYIDKLPLNIIHIAEILTIFPEAKFIFSVRHPCDCVLSCFMQDFKLNNAMSNFLDLNDTAYLYEKIMRLWFEYKSKFSFNFHEIRYENLISNFENELRPLLIFLGLKWNDSIFEFQKVAKNRKRIFTPSYEQVIKPIYQSSVNRWTRYKTYFSKVYPILKPWIKKLNYE